MSREALFLTRLSELNAIDRARPRVVLDSDLDDLGLDTTTIVLELAMARLWERVDGIAGYLIRLPPMR